MQNDKIQLAAMGAHLAEQQPMCMAKRIEELEAQVRVMAELLREAQECVVHDVVRGMGRDVESLWARIDDALAGKLPEPAVPDAAVALSDIASLRRYTLGGHCDSFGQDCGAEMEPDDEGEYILLAEALMLYPAPKPEAK